MTRFRWLGWQGRAARLANFTGQFTAAAISCRSLEELLVLGAGELLAAGQADRAGVWLSQDSDGGLLRGAVVGNGAHPAPASWTALHRSARSVAEVLRAGELLVEDAGSIRAANGLAVLQGMRTATWIPLRGAERAEGLAMVAQASPRRGDPGKLRALADLLALALLRLRESMRLEQVQGEQRLLQAQLRQTEKLAALGRLVSGTVHELNNPLTGILGYTELLLARRATARSVELHRVHQEAERARRIVSNLLRFARDTLPERRPARLNEIVERTAALRSYHLRVENIALELDMDPGLPAVLADPHQIEQVVLNLLVNSEQALLQARAGGPGGPRPGRIQMRTRAGAQRVTLQVADDGPGIPPEVARRVFDPFFTTKRIGEGTGLGLFIAREIVREHEGEIRLEPGPADGFACGASFVVDLPAGAAEEEDRGNLIGGAEEATAGAAQGGADPAEMRVLVVEDEATVAQLVVDVLKEDGYRVEAVLDAAEGFARVLRNPYDLVVCDLKMPGLDGRAFFHRLVRAGSPLRHRILFITGDTLAPRTLDFLDSSNLPFLAKPFLVEELRSAVRRALTRARDGRPAPRLLAPAKAAGSRAETPRKK